MGRGVDAAGETDRGLLLKSTKAMMTDLDVASLAV